MHAALDMPAPETKPLYVGHSLGKSDCHAVLPTICHGTIAGDPASCVWCYTAPHRQHLAHMLQQQTRALLLTSPKSVSFHQISKLLIDDQASSDQGRIKVQSLHHSSNLLSAEHGTTQPLSANLLNQLYNLQIVCERKEKTDLNGTPHALQILQHVVKGFPLPSIHIIMYQCVVHVIACKWQVQAKATG